MGFEIEGVKRRSGDRQTALDGLQIRASSAMVIIEFRGLDASGRIPIASGDILWRKYNFCLRNFVVKTAFPFVKNDAKKI